MKYIGKKELIKTIQQTARCPECHSAYSQQGINVIGELGDIIFVHLQCDFCHKPVLATVKITHQTLRKEKIAPFDLQKNEFKKFSPKTTKITSDDIIEAYIFFKNFDGDFERLFKADSK